MPLESIQSFIIHIAALARFSRASMDKVKQVIDAEKRRDPSGFAKAEKNGELLSFLGPAFRRAKIDPTVLQQYCDSGRMQSGEPVGLDDYVDLASGTLDEIFFEPFYQHQLPSNNLGIADTMASFRSAGHISTTLKRIKVACAVTSLISFALSIRYGMTHYFLHAIVLGILAADLFRISFNCYEKKYCSLYLDMIGGSAVKITETIFKFAKAAVGISDPADDPFVRLRTEIVWRNLIQDTIILGLVHKVCIFNKFRCQLANS